MNIQGGLDNIIFNLLHYAHEHLKTYKLYNDVPLRDMPNENRNMVMKVRQVD